MDRPKWTKGPWTFEARNWRGEEDPRRLYISGDAYDDYDEERPDEPPTRCATGVAIVEVPTNGRETATANARLIAAAPALYVELDRLCAWCEALDFDGSEYIRGAVRDARDALALAHTPDPPAAGLELPEGLPCD